MFCLQVNKAEGPERTGLCARMSKSCPGETKKNEGKKQRAGRSFSLLPPIICLFNKSLYQSDLTAEF